MRHVASYGLLVALISMVCPGPALDVTAQDPQVSPGESVRGYVDNDGAEQIWEFQPQRDQTLTVLVNAFSDGLDPAVAVWDEDDNLIAENDDRIPGLDRDASASDIAFEGGTTYRIAVSGKGRGNYRLWLSPAHSQVWEAAEFEHDSRRWTTPYARQQRGQLVLNPDRLIGRTFVVQPEGSVPLTDAYIQAEFEWLTRTEGAALGLVIRAQQDEAATPAAYYFAITPDGAWSASYQQADTSEILIEPDTEGTLASDRITLGVRATGTTLTFYANGQEVGEHEDTRLERGTWGLYLESGGGDGSTVAVDNVLLTVPATDLDLEPPLTLDSWRSAQPAEIADELASNDLIPAGGQRTLLILETSYQIGSQEQRTYPQGEATLRPTDMVISIDAAIADGDNLACGIALRYVDDANQTIAYMDLDGGMGLLEVSDGMIRRHTYDFISESAAPLADSMIRLLVIARQDRVLMYVNGEYFTTHHAPPRQGQIGVALINYSTLSSRCVYENLWVWQW